MKINRRIVGSIVTIGATGALLIGATFAFFTDNETSTGNTFTAGTLDLKVDSECHYFQNGIDGSCGEGASFGNWSETDLEDGVHKFFNFDDIKPGDWGEDTISLHVIDNDAWGIFEIGSIDEDDGLRPYMEFWVWLDQGEEAGFQGDDPGEGDNVYDPVNEPLLISPGEVDLGGETWNLWDGLSAAQVFNGGDNGGVLEDGRLVGSTTYYFGLAWCFGEADPDAVALADVCDGSGVSNDAQDTSLTGDISFSVVQHRNNPTKEGLGP